jgi:hypothetical protein
VLVADGHVERTRRAAPSRVVVAAVATAMTACTTAPSKVEAPQAVIAVAPPTPVETVEPPSTPAPMPPQTPHDPRARTKNAAPSSVEKAPHEPPHQYDLVDGDAW